MSRINHAACECYPVRPYSESEWEKVGESRLVPNPGIFGQKTYWSAWCHGRPMARYKELQTMRCRQCGGTKDFIMNRAFALCRVYRCSARLDETSYNGF